MLTDATAVEATNLAKSFRTARGKPLKRALGGISLQVRQGGIYGLLGPNGAGKTTTLKIIMNFLRPDSGEVAIFGGDWRSPASRARVGFLPEQPYFNMYLTPRKLLRFYGKLFGMAPQRIESETERLLTLVGLEGSGDTILQKFSRGMLQRVGFAQALLNSPELLILDEPSSGLDPIAQFEIKELMLNLKSKGVTVFLSSHQLSEVEELCDYVSVLKAGRIVAEGSLADLLRTSDKRRITLQRPVSALPADIGRMGVKLTEKGSSILAPEEALYPLLDFLKMEGIALSEVREERVTLEEFFMQAVRGDGLSKDQDGTASAPGTTYLHSGQGEGEHS